jgi:plastocyanin
MSKSAVIFMAIALVVIVVVIFVSLTNKNNVPSANTQTTTDQSTSESDTTDALDSDSSDSSETVNTVHYTDSGYSPASIEVSVGTAVTFVNDSTQSMWTASDPHPVHTNFSAFDAKRGYKQGVSYSFTFAKAGTYTYHNHLVPGDVGTVVVK